MCSTFSDKYNCHCEAPSGKDVIIRPVIKIKRSEKERQHTVFMLSYLQYNKKPVPRRVLRPIAIAEAKR
jgi:hypothetical protein